jgi:hypothetical protein
MMNIKERRIEREVWEVWEVEGNDGMQEITEGRQQ